MKENKSILDKVKEYEEAKRKLSEEIGFRIELDIETSDCLKWYWNEQNYEINWLDSNKEEYGEEARKMKEFDDCCIFMIYHCTGNKYYAVFSKENESNEQFD